MARASWPGAVENGTTILENCEAVSTNAQHRPTPGHCTSPPACASQRNRHTRVPTQAGDPTELQAAPPSTTHDTPGSGHTTDYYSSATKRGRPLEPTTMWANFREITSSKRRHEERIPCDGIYRKSPTVKVASGSSPRPGVTWAVQGDVWGCHSGRGWKPDAAQPPAMHGTAQPQRMTGPTCPVPSTRDPGALGAGEARRVHMGM